MRVLQKNIIILHLLVDSTEHIHLYNEKDKKNIGYLIFFL